MTWVLEATWDDAEYFFPESSAMWDVQFGGGHGNFELSYARDMSGLPTELHMVDPMCGYEVSCNCLTWNKELKKWEYDFDVMRRNEKIRKKERKKALKKDRYGT